MSTIALGPMVLPLAPLVLLLALLLARVVATLVARRRAATDQLAAVHATVRLAFWAGLLGARVGHVALAWPAYAASPLDMIDIRDGGWQPLAGAAVALGVVAWRAWQWRLQAPPRDTLAAASLAGLLLWGGASLVLLPRADAGPGLQALMLPVQALDDGRTTFLAEELLGRAGRPAASPAIVAASGALRGASAGAATRDGRPVVLNAWATWCPPCRAEMPVLAAAQRANPQVRFVFVDQGESPELVKAWLQAAGLTLADVWIDPAGSTTEALGSKGMPTTVFFDAAGQRVDTHLGALNQASLQARLARLTAAAAR